MSIPLNYENASLRVCVDDAANGMFRGRIVGKRLNAAISFSDINDFILQVDALLDIQKFPQAFQRIRSFTERDMPDVPAALTPEELINHAIDDACGNVATFMLLISTRQNTSWQGYIDWMDSGSKQFFSSTLELLRLIDAHLNQ